MKDIVTKVVFGVLFCGLILSGCVQRELEERPAPVPLPNGTMHLTINFPVGFTPDGSRVLLYRADGSFHSEQTLSGGESVFTRELESGEYRLIIHNTDAQNVDITGVEDHASAAIFAGSGAVPSAGSEILSPRNVYSVSGHDLAQTVVIKAGETSTITATPARLTHEVKLRFKILGLDAVTELKGRLSGISPGVFLATGSSLPIACLQRFVGTVSVAKSGGRSTRASEVIWYETDLEFFDLVSSQHSGQGTNTLDVSITDGGGTVYILATDITSVVDEIIFENGGMLPIEIPLEMEVAVNPQTSNVTVTVTPWDESGTGGGSPRTE